MAQFNTDIREPDSAGFAVQSSSSQLRMRRQKASKDGSWSDQEPLGTHLPRLAIPVTAFTTFTGRDQASRR